MTDTQGGIQTAQAAALTAEPTADTARTAPVKVMDLEDIAIRVEMNLKRAICIMAEITTDYLGRPGLDNPNHPEAWTMFAGYEEYSTKADIVYDYLVNLRDVSQELTDLSRQTFTETKRIQEAQPS